MPWIEPRLALDPEVSAGEVLGKGPAHMVFQQGVRAKIGDDELDRCLQRPVGVEIFPEGGFQFVQAVLDGNAERDNSLHLGLAG